MEGFLFLPSGLRELTTPGLETLRLPGREVTCISFLSFLTLSLYSSLFLCPINTSLHPLCPSFILYSHLSCLLSTLSLPWAFSTESTSCFCFLPLFSLHFRFVFSLPTFSLFISLPPSCCLSPSPPPPFTHTRQSLWTV